MARKKRWDWLSGPLAHDFANTVHWRGTTPIDHIADPAGLRDWLEHEPHPLPAPAQVTEEAASAIRRLRDAVRAAMIAIASGDDPNQADLDAINDAARRNPVILALSTEGTSTTLETASEGTDLLLGVLAHAAVAAIGEADQRAHIAFCAAPGCGGLFHRDRTNQVWCDPHCGARARADRHQHAQA